MMSAKEEFLKLLDKLAIPATVATFASLATFLFSKERDTIVKIKNAMGSILISLALMVGCYAANFSDKFTIGVGIVTAAFAASFWPKLEKKSGDVIDILKITSKGVEIDFTKKDEEEVIKNPEDDKPL